MYDSLHEVIFLAQHHGYRFIPAAGPDWPNTFDRGKQPLVKWAEATADPGRLKAWAADPKFARCNWWWHVGDGRAVLDVDPRHGGDALLAELEATHGPLPRTAKVRTGGGGFHFHFTAPAGFSLKADIAGNNGLTLIVGDGKGGVIVPPCKHASGGVYAWEAAPWDVGPAECPAWLIAAAQAGGAGPAQVDAKGDGQGMAVPPATRAAAPSPASAEASHPAAPAAPPKAPATGVAAAPANPMLFVWGGGGDRLATHPGCPTGRRKVLWQLVGRELGYGRDADAIEAEAVAWAGRCDPPMDEQRAIRYVRGLCKRHRAKQHTPPSVVPPTATGPQPSPPAFTPGEAFPVVKADAEPSPPAFTTGKGEAFTSVPQPSPDDQPSPFTPGEGFTAPSQPSPPVNGEGFTPAWLTHGLIGEFAEAVAGEIEGSVEPVVGCLLSCFGSAAGPGPFVRVGADTHKANLFAVCVAPSGVGKSDPWAVCSALMRYADPEWLDTAVTYGLGSGEGLIEKLEATPTAFALEAEFGGVLAKARREGSTLTPTICNAWDGRTLEVSNRGKAKLKAQRHHVSAWANVTDAELGKRLGRVDTV